MTLTEDLLALYRVDSQLRGLRTRVENATRTLKIREQQLADLSLRREELQTNIRMLQATSGNLEGDAGDLESRVEKLRVDLNAATTDKQYKAILSELTQLKDQRDSVDEQNIAEMERIDILKGELTELDAKIEERTGMRDLAAAEAKQRQEDVAERVQELEKERAVAAESIPAKAMEIFDRVADSTEGETLAPVIEHNRKRHEFICGACNIEIPYNLFVTLHAGTNEIQQCPACTRILHLETVEAAS
ncbi:MAG: hypothetical protein MK085_11850 [Phycisphaerales bacterium]|nr:hypothetical protein [Phycisphaerales bacterium]